MLRNDQADADRQPDAVRQTGLLDYLLESDLAGMQHLRPYLKKLLAQGRLLLLCDGLDEVDAHYRAAVSAELAELLLMTQNRFVITCREADYLEQQDIVKLVNEGHIERALMRPLQLEQVREFIEQYIEDQPGGWQHTAGQIMQLIEYNRSEEHTSELQSHSDLVCRLLLEKKNKPLNYFLSFCTGIYGCSSSLNVSQLLTVDQRD